MLNSCFVVCILVFAPQIYIELPLGSSRRELHLWTLEYCLLTYSRSYDKKFQKSKINSYIVVFILVFAPQLYIELPLESSRRELHFWTLGFWLLTYSGAMTKYFRRLRSILALSFSFQYLLPRYTLSSLQGAPGGNSIFWQWVIGCLHIQEL